jgi:hypothetical protein
VGLFLARQARFCLQEYYKKIKICFFQARILYRRNSKRILTDHQEKQESGKNDAKSVDYSLVIDEKEVV